MDFDCELHSAKGSDGEASDLCSELPVLSNEKCVTFGAPSKRPDDPTDGDRSRHFFSLLEQVGAEFSKSQALLLKAQLDMANLRASARTADSKSTNWEKSADDATRTLSRETTAAAAVHSEKLAEPVIPDSPRPPPELDVLLDSIGDTPWMPIASAELPKTRAAFGKIVLLEGPTTVSTKVSDDAASAPMSRQSSDGHKESLPRHTRNSRRTLSITSNVSAWRTRSGRFAVDVINESKVSGVYSDSGDKASAKSCCAGVPAFFLFVVESTLFETIFSTVNVGYAAFIGFDTQTWAQTGRLIEDTQLYNGIFNICFIVELIARIIAYNTEFFRCADKRWNALDVILTLLSGADLLVSLTTSSSSASAGRTLRLVRLVRITRTVRIGRALKSVREFQKMAYSLISSMRTLICAMLILSAVMYVFAITFCQAVAEHTMQDDAEEMPLHRELLLYFHDVQSSFFSLFLCVSNGISWTLVHEPLAQMDAFYGYCFTIFISIVIFGVLNVVTSVFVEAAIMSAQHYKDLIIQDQQLKQDIAISHMKQVFAQMDQDKSGEISMEEMQHFLEQPSLHKYMEALHISAQDTRMLFRLLDNNGSGQVDIDEFCEGCLRLQGEARSFDIHALSYTLRRFLGKWTEFTDYVDERLGSMASRLPQEGAGSSAPCFSFKQSRPSIVSESSEGRASPVLLSRNGSGTLSPMPPRFPLAFQLRA